MIGFSRWTDDQLRTYILRTEDDLDELKDSLEWAKETLREREAKTLREVMKASRPYLNNAILYLGGLGYQVCHDPPIEELGGATYYSIVPPYDQAGKQMIRRYWGERDEALLHCAIDILGDLSEWASRMADKA